MLGAPTSAHAIATRCTCPLDMDLGSACATRSKIPGVNGRSDDASRHKRSTRAATCQVSRPTHCLRLTTKVASTHVGVPAARSGASRHRDLCASPAAAGANQAFSRGTFTGRAWRSRARHSWCCSTRVEDSARASSSSRCGERNVREASKTPALHELPPRDPDR